jgi:hypothetical protein
MRPYRAFRRWLWSAVAIGGIVTGMLALAGAPAVGAAGGPAFVQGSAFTTGSRLGSLTLTLSKPVGGGDLLVGWFAQYNAAAQVQVSDNVNGSWTRAPGALAFQNDTGDIALYYVENSKPVASGATVTVSVAAPAYLQGSLADYSGIASAGALNQIVSRRGVGTAVDTGPTAPVGAGEMVFSALVTGGNPAGVTPGSTLGVSYAPRAQTATGSAFAEDVTSTLAGGQDGTATLGAPTDWYAVAAVFEPPATGDTQPPTVPADVVATSVASTRVALSWSPSTDQVQVVGYTVYRNGSPVGTAGGSTTSFIDTTTTASTSYSYTVDAFNGAGMHSARSSPVAVTTPATSPRLVQGTAASPGERATSLALTLPGAVGAGDLLVGWFGEYDGPGQVQVSDNVNGAWTRSASETFTNGLGDIALYYVQNAKAAPSGVTVTVSAPSPAYLQEALADYAGVATTGALDQVAASEGVGVGPDSGPTAPVSAGDLVIAAVITGGQPGSDLPGTSQNVPWVLDTMNGSGSSAIEDILAGAAGAQEGRLTLGVGSDWYMVVAAFHSGT